MYLLDTNIFLEYILSRTRVEEVKDFFHRADPATLHISDFSPNRFKQAGFPALKIGYS